MGLVGKKSMGDVVNNVQQKMQQNQEDVGKTMVSLGILSNQELREIQRSQVNFFTI